MNTNVPLLTIVIPTKNRYEFLTKSVGIFAKFSNRLEIIVIDDGSDKKISELNNSYVLSCDAKYIKNDISIGAPKSRNLGVNLATSNYIWFFDDDDEPNDITINDILNVVEKANESTAYLLPMITKFGDNELNLIYPEKEKNTFEYYRRFKHQVNTSCAVFPKQSLLSIGCWDENLISGQDTDLFFRYSEIGEFDIVNTQPIIVNIGHINRITSKPKKQFKGYIQFLKKHWRKLSTRKRFYYVMRIVLFTPYIRYFKSKFLSSRYRSK